MSQGHASSPRSQYSVPTEQFKPNGNGEPSYTSESNMGIYTSSASSLVLGGTGRTIWSNPGSPKSNMADTLKLNQHTTSYCDSQLPLPVCTDATVVIGEGNHSAYINAFSNSNMSLVMSQQGLGGEDLPNEACNSHNSNLERLHAKILMNQHSIPVDPLQGSDVYFQEPASIGTDYSAEAHSDANVDVSVLLDSHSLGMGHSVSPADNGGSSMVTGVGGENPAHMAPFNYSPATVYEDPFDTMMRDLVTSELSYLGSTSDVGFPDPELLKFIDSGALAEPSLAECLSTPVNSDFITGFDGMSIRPVQAGQNQQGTMAGLISESIQEQSATGDNLDIIKMLNVQLKPTAPASLGLKESHMVPKMYIPSPAQGGHQIPPSPCTPEDWAPIQVSIPPSPGPLTPQTPCLSQKGPFELQSYVEGDQRVCEISVRSDLTPMQQQIATQALFFSLESHVKITECLTKRCDLKVAIDARAELSGAKFDLNRPTLQFTMPKDCMHVDKWLRVHKEDIDLRDRQLVLQQVINLLAAVHTVGSTDKLCLWGSFMVWVAPNKRVYLLIDFPEMLSKMEAQANSMSFDPRIEDVKAIYELYQKIFVPFINQDSSWVSPGVKQLVQSFNILVADPSSVYRMAELARTLGERRLCKLEVELMTLCHYVYCVEHEPLCKVLAHITSMVPPVACNRWEVQWAESGALVGRDVMASAHRPIRLHIQPVPQIPVAFAGLPDAASAQGLSFKSNSIAF